MEIADRQLRQKPQWRPSLLIASSLLLHALAGAALVFASGAWPYALGAVAANHVFICIAGLLPRSSLLGANTDRLPATSAARGEVALTIDDGPDPQVTPRVLDILDRHEVKASFFCVGDAALRYPELCREIIRRGHAIENHGQSHSNRFAMFGPRAMAQDIDLCQRTLLSYAGNPPQFFRPTAGLRNPFLDPLLARRDLRLVSWTRRAFDTSESDPQIVYRRLARNLAAGDILVLHDGNAARTASGIPVIVEVLPRLLEACREAQLHPVTLRAAIR